MFRKVRQDDFEKFMTVKHKNNTLRLCSQQPKMNFGDLYNYIRFYL